MCMDSWAEREIEILKSKNKPESDEEFDYVGECAESALRAYKCLMSDGHSGMSISITAGILNKLIKGQALTSIEDTEDAWNESGGYCDEEKGIKHYQSNRMSSLFKDVYPDGTVKYSDIDRVTGINMADPDITYTSGTLRAIVDEMFPITMPYSPKSKSYKVYTEDFLTDKSKGDYDTVGYLYMITPEGEKIELNKFYHEFNRHEEMKEITKEEYEELKKRKIENRIK